MQVKWTVSSACEWASLPLENILQRAELQAAENRKQSWFVQHRGGGGIGGATNLKGKNGGRGRDGKNLGKWGWIETWVVLALQLQAACGSDYGQSVSSWFTHCFACLGKNILKLFSINSCKIQGIKSAFFCLSKTSLPRKTIKTYLKSCLLLFSLSVFSVEHPAAGYKKIFETVEELNEPINAEISGRRETATLLLYVLMHDLPLRTPHAQNICCFLNTDKKL